MGCRKCAKCGIKYPADADHRTCLACGKATAHAYNLQPHPPDEVKRRVANAKFEAFYKERGEREVDIDWERLLHLREVQALESIPTLDEHPSKEMS